MHNPSEALDTIPKWFLHTARKVGSRKVAIRQKELGIWQEFTWDDSLNNVRDLCLGLTTLGLERGDRLCIVGDNDRFYLWGDLAAMCAGVTVVGIFTDSRPEEMEYVINHSEAVIVLGKDQEQCDKLLDIRDRIPNVRQVIYWDSRGMWSYHDPWLMSFADIQQLGRKLHADQPDLFERLVAQGEPEEYANFCYTSGTTGLPKGAMLTHTNFIRTIQITAQIEPRHDTDNLVSFSPLAWIAEHTLAVVPHCVDGVIINFPESPETVQQNIREICPNIIFFPARLWENIVSTIQVRINDSTWWNRLLYRAFLPIGYRVAEREFHNQSVGPLLRALHWLGDQLVFKPLRWQLGLGRIRTALTAGAALSPDMLTYFRALGLNLKQVFGTTETTGAATQHRDHDVKFESVGTPIPDVQVRISDDGELLVGGPNIFMGYFKNEEATAKALSVDEEGTRWFHTGDAGYVDEHGHVIYLDRMKDMIALRSGEKYSPQYIEGRLKFSPYIKDVMSVGGGDFEYVTALIAIDFENVGRWAEKNRLAYTTYVDLSQKPEVYELIRKDVERVNQTLPAAARVARFVLLHKEFDADEAEMTRTRKLRRGFLLDRYQDIVESLYRGDPSVRVSAKVSYRDGRESLVETDVRIMTLEDRAPLAAKEMVAQ